MTAYSAFQKVSVDGVVWEEPDAGEAIFVLPSQSLEALLRFGLLLTHLLVTTYFLVSRSCRLL